MELLGAADKEWQKECGQRIKDCGRRKKVEVSAFEMARGHAMVPRWQGEAGGKVI